MEKLTNPAQKLLIGILMAVILALASCKGNPSTMSGDSTGTGAAGARTPGFTTKDTTSHDTTGGGTGDSAKNHIDTTKKK